MAKNEVHPEGEALTLVFDPNIDFKNSESRDTPELSPEISYLINLSHSSIRSQKKYLYIYSSRPNADYYTFDEDHYKQLVSYIFHPNTKVTNSTPAEVHRLKLSPHCRVLPCQINPTITTHILRDISLEKLLQDKRENSDFEDLLNWKLYRNGDVMEESSFDNRDCHPSIHSSLKQQQKATELKNGVFNDPTSQLSTMNTNSKSQLILVPHEDQSGHQHEVIQEVYRYPPCSIEMVVERNGESSSSGGAPRKDKRKNSHKMKSYTSQSSLGSTNSALSCQSTSSLASQNDSVISCGRSHKSLVLNDSLNGKAVNHLNGRKLLSSSKELDQCGSDAMSDSSSNLSTMSDLSGYEDEYVMIKRLICDRPNKVYGKRIVSESLRKRTYLETKVQEQECTIKCLNSVKEDLEIQVHRLSVQLQNSVREKEVCQEQLDIVQTKLAEKKQQEFFELMKDKLSLEGQSEALKQELQYYSTASAELDSKLRENKNELEKLEKENSQLCSLEIELKKSIANTEHQNIKLKSDLKALNETIILERNLSRDLKIEIEEKENIIKELEVTVETCKQEAENYQETICTLKKWNLEYSEREEQQRMDKKRMENLIAESTDKFKSLKESGDWYQMQLKKAHEQVLELQNELTETKSSLSVVSGDRDRCKREVEKLTVEVEDNRVKAMRDKSLLLVQLEELEADMKEREMVIRRLEEGEKISHVKLSEDRFKRLEEDHKRLHEMKIEMRDILRHNDALKEDLKHKSFVVKKSEDAIRDLRKDFAVAQEELGSKDVCIGALKEKLNEVKSKLEKAYDKVKENDLTIAGLKEQKLQLEASALTAEQDKKQVDETIAKLKEDMSKLSSNFFRMKHDLSAKDKQIELLSAQNDRSALTEKELASKVDKLEVQLKDDEQGKLLLKEINTLKELLAKSADENACIKKEVAQMKKRLESSELEKNSIVNSLKLRDEQIENMQGVIDAYKEKILQKDEELFNRKDQVSKLERNFDDLQKRFNRVNNEYQLQLQEKEEIRELETNYRNTICELKDSIKLEKRGKESWDKKYKEKLQELTDIKEQLEEKTKSFENLNEVVNGMEKELERLKLEDGAKNGLISALKEEVNLRADKLAKQENNILGLTSQLGELKRSLTFKENEYEEALNIKNSEICNLQESLNLKNSELKKMELAVTEAKQKRECAEISSRLHGSSRIDRNVRQNFKKSKNLKNFRDEKIEIENLKQKLLETSNMVTKKDEEINELITVRSTYESLKDLFNKLNFEHEEAKKQREFLRSENDALNTRCSALQCDLQAINANYISKEEECNQWRTKFENLSDTIPQRDTNPCYKIDGIDQLSCQRSYHECIPSLHTRERVKMTHEEEGVLQNINLEERVKFSQTMVYLQQQISLTAETLKNKDRQIMELNKQLGDLSSNSNVGSMHPASAGTQHFFNDRKNLGSNLCDKSTSIDVNLQSTDNEHNKELSAEVSKLQEILTCKDVEFKEKKRRYESNLRLLTRKLKEHMKGRRTAEKELDLVSQEQKKNMDEGEKRYNVLKNRYIDLEKKCQRFEAEMVSKDVASREKDAVVISMEKDLEKERNFGLQMQKEIGQKEQLNLCLGNLRSEINALNFESVNKNKKLQELEDSLRSSLRERQFIEDRCHSLSLQVADLDQSLQEEINKVTERDKLLSVKEDNLIKSTEDMNSLKETLAAVHLKCDHLEESLERIQTEDINNTKKISLLNEEVEALKSCIDVKNALAQDLDVKMTILEKELEIKQGAIETLKSECAEIKKQSLEGEEKNETTVALLNKRISEANEVESSLNERVALIHKEKMAFQSQCTQLKIALNSALEKLKGSSSSNLPSPSPSPLNTEALAKLMEQCSKPAQTNKFMTSLTERLHSLREEVSVLQSEIKNRDQIQ